MPEDLDKYIDLEEFDADFEAAEAEADYGEITDGSYQAVVESLEIKKTKETKRPMITWSLRIIAPKFIGRYVWKNSVITGADSVKYIKQDLYAAGLQIQKLSELKDHLNDIKKTVVQITVKHKDGYENVYINKKLDINAPDAPGGLEEDIPF